MTWPKLLVLLWILTAATNTLVRRYRLPPSCGPDVEEQAVVCRSWRPFMGDLVEIKRFPFPDPEPTTCDQTTEEK
jgi:hypothetical protein